MRAKTALGGLLILASTVVLIYAAIAEIQGSVSYSLLFGLILISVFVLFAGIAIMRNEVKEV